ncbi:thioesterase family protein [Streptomyces sp. NPDC086554]|uniref:acyl-CoA thioesterase n=1 Tax=Streptomyces sp. NPDC086554 TaxID=3154864 RepID=UPI003421D84E
MPRYTNMCALRWSDMDANGHMNNAVYATYLEETRFRMFSQIVPDDPAERLSSNFVVSEQTIKFARPLVYREEPVTVEAWITDMKGASFTICCEIKDGEEIYVSARTLMVGYDSAAKRPRRLSEYERSIITSFTG